MTNPHLSPSLSPLAPWRSMWEHRKLIARMTWRDVVGRYRGSVLGLMWSLLTPLLMLAVYTFVFSVVFKARWSDATETSRAQFAIILFVGLLVHGLFAEVVNQSPRLVLNNANYVKKVVFPLEILPVVQLGAALFHMAIGMVVLTLALLVAGNGVPLTALWLPVVLLPLLLITLGFAWALAALGVFLRDVGQVTALFTTILMFLSPVFFPISALPSALQPWMRLNPLAFIIEQTRAVLIWGRAPDWAGGALLVTCAALFAWLGYAWFQATRKGFADVL